MRAVGAARWFLSSAGIVALAALLAPERASATCTFNGPDQGIVALGGPPPDACSAAAGAYNGLPAAHPPQGVGFYAADNGSITATTGVITITTPNFGVQANGGQIGLNNGFTTVVTSGVSASGFYSENGGLISLNNITTSVETTGVSAYGFFAQSGGQIILGEGLPGLVRVRTHGSGAFGLYASGTGSSGTGSNITIDTFAGIQTAGTGADGVVADADGVVNLASGGAVTTGVGTSHAAAVGVLASTGGQVTLTGVSVTTSGADAPGILATGDQSTVTTSVLPAAPGVPGDPLNPAYPPIPTTVATTGDHSPGAEADSGGQVSLNAGSVTTSGIGSFGLYATGADESTGAKSTITATDVAVTTGASPGPGTGAVGVLAEAGGQAILHRRVGDDERQQRLRGGGPRRRARTAQRDLDHHHGQWVGRSGNQRAWGPRSTRQTSPFRPLASPIPARARFSIPMGSTMARSLARPRVSRQAALQRSRTPRSRRKAC